MIQDAARRKRCFLEPTQASAAAWSSRRRLCRLLGLERSDQGLVAAGNAWVFTSSAAGEPGLQGRRGLWSELKNLCRLVAVETQTATPEPPPPSGTAGGLPWAGIRL